MAEELSSGAENIHEWLAQSSLAFEAAENFPFGPSPLSLPHFALDDDLPSPSSSDNDDESQARIPSNPNPLESFMVERFKAKEKDFEDPPVKQWSTEQPFVYSGRLLLVCLPGLLLVLSLAGDYLITVVTIGAMVVHLLHSAGETHKAFVAYVCTFICSQMLVVYSAFPLLWNTVLNIFLIGALNTYTVLTGAWGLLFFRYFRVNESELARVIETSLLGLYPAVNVILLTWIVASAVSHVIAPYVLLSVGFMVLQVFMTPVPSSFWRVRCKKDERDMKHVLDNHQIGTMAFIYTILPPVVYLYLTFIHGQHSLFSLTFMVEFIFLGSLSSFLATLMNLREFLEVAGMEYKNLVRVRWVLGVSALVLLNGVLHKYGFSSALLPWLALGLALHTGYGFAANQRKYRELSLTAAVLLIVLYIFLFTRLPWKLHMYLEASGLHINLLLVLLFINTLICVLCVYIAAHGRNESLSFFIVCQSIAFVACEKLLWHDNLYPNSLLLISTVFAIYALLRLHHINKLPWVSSWVSIAIHSSKVCTGLRAVLPHPPLADSISSTVYEEATTVLLALVFLKGFLFEKDTVTLRKWMIYMFLALTSLSFCMSALLYKVLLILFSRSPIFSDLTALGLLMTACLSIKLTLHDQEKTTWSGVGHVGPTAIVGAVVLFFLKPEAAPTWEDINKWSLIGCLVGAFLLAPVATKTKSPLFLCTMAGVLGLPFGVSCAYWVLPEEITSMVYVIYGIVASCLACTSILIWRHVHKVEVKVYWLLDSVLVCCILLLVDDHALTLEDGVIPPGLLLLTLSSILTSFILKVHSLREKLQDLTTLSERIDWLALLGNAACLTAFFITCTQCTSDAWEVWWIISCTLLLLLQKDQYLFRSLGRENNAAPMLMFIPLILLYSSLTNNALLFNDTARIIRKIAGFVELVLLFTLTPPVYFVFYTTLWSNRFFISDRIVVFVTPLNAFFIIVGSSYQAWAYALYSLSVGYWLMAYKLPLLRDYV